MAKSAGARSQGRRVPAPGPHSNLWLKLRECTSHAVDAAARRWLWLLALACVVGLAALGQWNAQLLPGSDHAALCAKAALRFDVAANGHCAAQLRSLVATAKPADEQTCAPEGRNKALLCALEEPGWPRLFVWADNLLVGLYTLFFVGCISVSYTRLRAARDPAPRMLQFVFALAIASCLAGAVADLGENFWLLAHIGESLDGKAGDVAKVVVLTLWKFRVAGLNLVFVLLWVGWAQFRHQVPHAVLFPWPRWCWDRASHNWFDADTVLIDPLNSACAYPLYPRDLVGLSGAPRGAELTCRREGDTLRLTVVSSMFYEPYLVTVELDPAQRRIRSVSLACPNLAPCLRDQGLAERMVLVICRTAWQLGAVSLESTVPSSLEETTRTQSRRWTRMALRLGWDADLPESALQTLPPGLCNLRSLQALMLYPDGRKWWSTSNVALQLRFVSNAKCAQADAKRPDPDQLVRNRLCLVRLQTYAASKGIRLAI